MRVVMTVWLLTLGCCVVQAQPDGMLISPYQTDESLEAEIGFDPDALLEEIIATLPSSSGDFDSSEVADALLDVFLDNMQPATATDPVEEWLARFRESTAESITETDSSLIFLNEEDVGNAVGLEREPLDYVSVLDLRSRVGDLFLGSWLREALEFDTSVGLLVASTPPDDRGGVYVWHCTATLLSPGLIITNHHCTTGIDRIRRDASLASAHFIPGTFTNEEVKSLKAAYGRHAQGLTSLEFLNLGYRMYEIDVIPDHVCRDRETCATLDYAIHRVVDNIAGLAGRNLADTRDPEPGEVLYMIQYPKGFGKMIVFDNCQVHTRDGAISTYRFEHTCDSRTGSSGSVIIAQSDNSVVGLHMSGSSFNQADFPPPFRAI